MREVNINFLGKGNLYISMNGFISPKSARVSNLLYINVWAIDVDYKKDRGIQIIETGGNV